MRFLTSALLLLSTGLTFAVDAPTEAQWTPIQAAIEADDPAARDRLQRLMEGRDWPDGWVKLADLDRRAGDHAACFAHAKQAFKALSADPSSTPHRQQVAADAHWLAIHAANQLGKPEIGLKVFASFGQQPDPRGEVHFRAAEASLLSADPARADSLLTIAKRRASEAGASVPLGYRFLEARIYEARAAAAEPGSQAAVAALEAAAATYRRALEGESLPGAWFNLGRMQRQLARQLPAKRADYLDQAGTSFRKVLEIDPEDADARFELGLVRLEEGDAVSAYNAFNTALKQYLADQSTADAWMVATAYRGRGTAMLQMAEIDPTNWSHDEALADLERARQLGETSDDLYNNLLVAYLALQRRMDGTDSGLAAKIEAILDQHADAIAPTNLGLSFLHQAKRELERQKPGRLRGAYAAADSATGLFRTALGISGDPTTWSEDDRERAALWRYLGHAHRVQSELAAALGAEQGRSNDANRHRQLAYAAWQVAGDLGDFQAQQHYLAYASQDDARSAYAAGWTMLGWRKLWSLAGWQTVAANYGASGHWRHPLHLALWGGLLLVLLLLGVKARFAGRHSVLPAGSPERTAPRPKPAAAERDPGETLMPDPLIRPRQRDQALAPQGKAAAPRAGTIPAAAAADESYLPDTLPKGSRNAVSDVARRLAREQQNQAAGQPKPRRRR